VPASRIPPEVQQLLEWALCASKLSSAPVPLARPEQLGPARRFPYFQMNRQKHYSWMPYPTC
jgi:hypothetical protein